VNNTKKNILHGVIQGYPNLTSIHHFNTISTPYFTLTYGERWWSTVIIPCLGRPAGSAGLWHSARAMTSYAARQNNVGGEGGVVVSAGPSCS